MTFRTAIAAATLAALGTTAAQAATFVGLTNNNEIGMFDSMSASTTSFMKLTGLGMGEKLMGLDLRPTDNMLYGVSNMNRIYAVDAMSGMATFTSALDIPVVNPNLSYGLDFNPVADYAGGSSMRLVSQTGNNFAINADTGVVGNAASIIPMNLTAVAYTNSMPGQNMGPGSTALYYIDTTTETLHMAASAFNSPTVALVGSLGISGGITGSNGFDIGADGMGWAALTLDNGDTNLYTVDLMTGLATYSSGIDGNLRGLTAMPMMAPVPEPETYAMMLAGLGLMGAVARRRMRK